MRCQGSRAGWLGSSLDQCVAEEAEGVGGEGGHILAAIGEASLDASGAGEGAGDSDGGAAGRRTGAAGSWASETGLADGPGGVEADAHRFGEGGEHLGCGALVVGVEVTGHASEGYARVEGVEDAAALVVVGGTGDPEESGRDEAAGGGFRDGDGLASVREEVGDFLCEGLLIGVEECGHAGRIAGGCVQRVTAAMV